MEHTGTGSCICNKHEYMKYFIITMFVLLIGACAPQDEVVPTEITLERSNADCECELGLSEREGGGRVDEK